ncbi:Haloacetate dehalogenase H-1 [compost metagenome]
MIRTLLTAFTLLALNLPAHAAVMPFPEAFRIQDIPVDGVTMHVRVGGKGPAVVLLHGFGDTGDMWAPLAADLARDHTVVVPDLRGMGAKVDEEIRQHYAKLYARPGNMRAAFAQFRSIRQDAVDNEASMAKKLNMPVLAVGGEKSFGANEAIVMRNAADKVTEVVIPGAGHWLMEEAPTQTIAAIRGFIEK